MNNVTPINVDGLPGLIGRTGQRLYAMRERADKAICLLDARMRTLTAEPEEGAATAEYAVVLPCVAAVAILVLCLGRASVVSMNCQDAAAAGARAFAVDDTGGESKARAAAVAAAGDSATVRFDRGTDSVTVTVQCPVIPDPTGMLPTRVTGKATRYF